MIYSGVKGLSVIEVLAGEKGRTLDPTGGHYDPKSGASPGTPTGASNLRSGGGWGGTKNVADSFRQIGTANGLKVTSSKRPLAVTATGGMSDHFIGNATAYAYDMSNGITTPQMDATVSQWCTLIGVNNTGKNKTEVSQVVTVDGKKFRVQILYRTYTGGDHFNHCHVGVKLV
jgi:hypothetical protein